MSLATFQDMRERLIAEKEIHLPARGKSMQPILRDGDILKVRAAPRKPRRFECYVYFDGRHLRCHYLWRRGSDGGWLFRSFVPAAFDAPVPAEWILGRVDNARVGLKGRTLAMLGRAHEWLRTRRLVFRILSAVPARLAVLPYRRYLAHLQRREEFRGVTLWARHGVAQNRVLLGISDLDVVIFAKRPTDEESLARAYASSAQRKRNLFNAEFAWIYENELTYLRAIVNPLFLNLDPGLKEKIGPLAQSPSPAQAFSFFFWLISGDLRLRPIRERFFLNRARWRWQLTHAGLAPDDDDLRSLSALLAFLEREVWTPAVGEREAAEVTRFLQTVDRRNFIPREFEKSASRALSLLYRPGLNAIAAGRLSVVAALDVVANLDSPHAAVFREHIKCELTRLFHVQRPMRAARVGVWKYRFLQHAMEELSASPDIGPMYDALDYLIRRNT